MARAPVFPGQMRLPKFYGDIINHPEESWQKYLNQIDLVYRAAGLTDPTEVMKHAHILSGLEGKAKQYYEANPRLNDLTYDELKDDLKKKFDKPNLQGLMEIGKLIQKPGESCAEFAARLKDAAKAINVEDDYVLVTKREALAAAEEAGEADNIRVRKEAVETHLKEQKLFMEKFVFHHFIRGMSERIRRIILPQHPRTLEKALELAEAEEQYLETYGGLLSEREINVTHKDETVMEAAKQLQALNVGKDSTKDKKENGFKGTGTKKLFSSSSIPQRHLRHQTNVKTASRQDLRCFFCARPGHVARDCKTRARYMRDGQGQQSQGEREADRPRVSHMQAPRPPFAGGVARAHQQGKRVSFNLSPREARSTLVDFLLNNQPYPHSKYREDRSTWVDFLNNNNTYGQSKNGVCYPPKGGSTTPFPYKNQSKYLTRK